MTEASSIILPGKGISVLPLVSILMPAFNVERYIDQAVQSILDQTYENWELLITDDGSADATAKKIKEYTDPRIRKFFFGKNKGNVAAVNFLFEKAKGLYIGFQDADDWSSRDRISAQVRFLESHPGFILCGTDYAHVHYDGRIEPPVELARDREAILSFIKKEHFPPVCSASVLFRASLLSQTDRYRPYFAGIGAADFDWYLRAMAYGNIANLPLVGYFYRKNLYSVTKTMTADPRKQCSMAIAYFLHEERLKQHSDSLQQHDQTGLHAFVNGLTAAYTEDPSLIYREMGYANSRKGFFGTALKNALTAISKKPFELKNLSLLKYIAWKKMNFKFSDLDHI